MNVVNFTDGVDGLAAGVCTIAAATFAVIALSLDRDAAGTLAALTAGASLGFLWHNFHPASIFMGDAGSNLLGLLLGCIAIQGVLKTAAVVALVFPLVILAVPILDTGFVVAKRIKYRQPVYQADREHFHHRFDRIGFSQRRTVLYLYGWTLSLAALALALRFVPYSDDHGSFNTGWTLVMVGFGLLAFAASVYLVYVLEILKFRRFRERQLRRPEPRSRTSTRRSTARWRRASSRRSLSEHGQQREACGYPPAGGDQPRLRLHGLLEQVVEPRRREVELRLRLGAVLGQHLARQSHRRGRRQQDRVEVGGPERPPAGGARGLEQPATCVAAPVLVATSCGPQRPG